MDHSNREIKNYSIPKQKIFNYDFLTNRVILKEEVKGLSKNKGFGGALKNLYQDNNPVIYNHLLQTNVPNDNINSSKRVYAGLENDYSEIPKKYYLLKINHFDSF